MRIAHLSDLHICAEHKSENILYTERLIEAALDRGMDHLVITGDISHNAQPLDFHILRDLLKKYDLLKPEKLSVTIGNHDVYGGVHLATDIIAFPQKCMNTNYNEKVREFGRYFEETFAGTRRTDVDDYFPYAKELGDLVIFGINTIAHYSKFYNPLASNGRVYQDQYERLRTLMADPRFAFRKKIVLMHHHAAYGRENENGNPLWHFIEKHSMKILGKRKLMNLFSKYDISFVFHGHIHINNMYSHRDTLFFNAGGSLEYEVNNGTLLNMIHIMDEDVNFERIKLEEEKIKVENIEFVDQLIPSLAS